MSNPADSIYPDFFRSGINRLQREGAWSGNLLGLFSALDHFRCDISEPGDVPDILRIAQHYIKGLELFHSVAFYLIDPADFSFKPAYCHPENQADALAKVIQGEIRSGKFAWALRQNVPVSFAAGNPPGVTRGVFHSLCVSTHRLGMFCGLVKQERTPSQEIAFSLLSMILGITSDALVAARNTAELKHQILVSHRDLERALRENEVLARIPAESPNPILRLSRGGQVLYANEPAGAVLATMARRIGDVVDTNWLTILDDAFQMGVKQEFEYACQGRIFAFVVAPLPEAGYASFYGTEITRRKQAEAEQKRLIGDLQEALARLKTLSGLVPICAWCKKIRDDRGYWKQLESFIESHSEAVFSHGVCPDCLKKINVSSGLSSPPEEPIL